MTDITANQMPIPVAKERVGFSLSRVGIIALNTFTESVRQKVYNVLIIFALVVIASSSFFSQFGFSELSDPREQLKFIKDFCLGALSVFGTLIAIVGTAQLLPNEVENRTIYTILSKPVRRFEFLLGKYMGSVLLLFLSLVMMSMMFGTALVFKENRLIAEAREEGASLTGAELQDTIRQIHAETMDPDLVKAVVLIFVKLGLLASITLLISTFSTSMVFNVVASFMIFFAGHLRGPASEVWGEHKLVMYLLAIIPDLGSFNVADDIIIGNVIPWSHVAEVATYGVARTALVVVVAHLIFSQKEI